MLLLVYRSVITVILLLLVVGIQLQVARGIVAFLGHHGFIGLTTFAVNLLVSLCIAAGTDYGIFFIGRYQEARQAGEDRETAYYTTYRGVAKVVLASGLTIAGAVFCLSFTRLPDFQAPWRSLARWAYWSRLRSRSRCFRRSSPSEAVSVCSIPSGTSRPAGGGG